MRAMDPAGMPYSRMVINKEDKLVMETTAAKKEVEGLAEKQAEIDSNLTWELERRERKFKLLERFIEPDQRRPDLVAAADVEYERMLRADAEARVGKQGLNYFDATTEGEFNKFAYVHSYLERHLGNEYDRDIAHSILKHREMIDRCFLPNSVEAIMENLRQEQHPFAAQILERMEANSMLSMKIALRLVREAKNKCFGDALRAEMNVALNKIGDADFALGVSNILLKPSSMRAPADPGFDRNISSD